MKDKGFGGDVVFVKLPCLPEEEAVFRHCIIDAAPGKYQPVQAAESGNHDNGSHKIQARAAKYIFHKQGAYAVVLGMGNCIDRHDIQVDEIN